MKKGIIFVFILFTILIITIVIALQDPSNYQKPFSGGTSGSQTSTQQRLPTISNFVVIFGKNSASMDYEAAKFIKNNLLTDFNVKLVYDTSYIDDGTSSIISVGGSCINKISAQLLSVNYPICGNDFITKTNIGQNQYLIKFYPMSNNRISILIAGFEAIDTWNAADSFNTINLNTASSNLNLIGQGTTPPTASTYSTQTSSTLISTTPSVTNPPSPTPAPSTTPSKSKTYNINIQNFAFSPQSLSVVMGDTIIWTNNDNTAHTVTSDISGTGLDSPVLQPGQTYTKTIAVSGPIDYHCNIHTFMKGHINSMIIKM